MSNKVILHISTFDFHGAGGAAYKIHRTLVEKGYSSSMLVMNKSKNDNTVVQVPISRIRRYFYRLIEKVENYFNMFDRDYFFFNRGIYLVDDLSKLTPCVQSKPDVIFVYWISKFISISVVNELALLYGAKVYLWVLDKEPMTGGCHYVNDCSGYLTQCKLCPAVPQILKKIPQSTYQKKLQTFSGSNLKLIYTTPWMKQMLSESPLLRGLEHIYIPSYFDNKVFDIRVCVAERAKVGIAEDDFVVLFGAVNVEEKRKGCKYLIDALVNYQERFDCGNIVLLSIGMGSLNLQQAGLRMKHIHLGPLNSESERALAYNMGDVLISPSTEDMGPAVLVEAMLCGLPVIAFDIGVAKDLIECGSNGYIAEFRNHIDVATKLHIYKSLDKNQQKKFRLCARSTVERIFPKSGYDQSINQIIN